MRSAFLYFASVLLALTVVEAAPISTDVLNAINAHRIPVSAVSNSDTSADNIQMFDK
ncbi:hypothetical protein BDQ17DRAFT_1437110 [Cyathus striatus]|nr:hypothetical protein BDQ17DRAFT_1437110 [Cyathus striatus]